MTSLYALASYDSWVFTMLEEAARHVEERSAADLARVKAAIREDIERWSDLRAQAEAEHELIMTTVGAQGPTPEEQELLNNLAWAYEPPAGVQEQRLMEAEVAALRVGIYVAAFAHLERCLEDVRETTEEFSATTKSEHGRLKVQRLFAICCARLTGLEVRTRRPKLHRVLAILRDRGCDVKYDARQFAELNFLRDELAHTGGYARETTRRNLKRLIELGDVVVNSDEGERVDLDPSFVRAAISSMRDLYIATASWQHHQLAARRRS